VIARAKPFWMALWAGFALSACQEPVNLGGTPSPTGTSEGAYREAYDLYLGAHRMLMNNLFKTHPPNFAGAQHSAERCVYELLRMQSLLTEPQRGEIGAIVAKYQNAAKRLSGRASIGTDAQVSDWEHVVRRDFVFHKVTLASSAPPPPGPDPGPGPGPAPASPPPVAQPPTPAPPPPSKGSAPQWLYFSAWEQLHAQLRAKWTAGEDCGPTFDRLIDTLERYRAVLAGDRGVKLETYIDSYRAAHKATSGFRQLPPGGTREDVLNDIKALESALRLYCTPQDKP
jgi:hypothetical protein